MRQCHQCKLITDIIHKNICFYCIIKNGELEKKQTVIQTEKIDKPKKKGNGLCNEEWV